MSPWRLLTTWDLGPALNMGLDEVLLETDGPPTLRLYSWSPDTLSLGYFQRYADVPATARASRVVRRITGGGAIHHDAGELTFALTCAASDPLYAGPVAGSYVRVHAAVIEALGAAGVEASLRGEGGLSSDRQETGMCFHASTPLDIAWLGRKGVGSAQRRRGTRVLHHGSIKLRASTLEAGIASLQAAGSNATREAVGAALVAALERQIGAALVQGEPSAEELDQAHARGEHYLSEAFVKKR